ncbi:Oidioi.mRNA.OKI2018_I69.XSR.g16946.t1.cds [Oikopleura dioica]|uniref:Oidioi.mRNA.OKI2018_I69.XSR.g16946.t1.cds n=1 Tax=Oikopleura dioica TaxID=34765 RepID=A0ABN7SS15_OIKDI|nr:Oidioi.mRNA.OKI2018_I69.XSR.g16946.t1.cds [Oikopleura dioica]
MCVASGVPDDEAAFCGKLTGSNLFFGNFVSFQFLAEGKSHREDGRPKCDCEGRVHWATEKSELIITSLLLGSYFIGKVFQTKRTKKDYRQTKCAFWIAIVGVYMRTNIISLVYEDPLKISDGNLTVTDFSCGNLKLTLADHFSYSHDLCHFYTDYQPLLREETPKIVLDTLDQIKKKENKDKLRELKKDLPPKSASDGFADLEIIKADFNPSNFNDLMKKMKLDNIIEGDPECTSETGDDCKND